MDDEQQAAWMIRTDADCDLTNSLDHCLMTLALAQGDLRNWKWCVTAAYSAAQTAMVMVLDAQGEWKHLKPNHREKLLEFLDKIDTEAAVPHPQTELNSFQYLVCNCAPLLPGGGVTHEMERGLNDLIYYRDHWAHFGVTSLGISVASAKRAVQAALDLIAELPLPSPRHGEHHHHEHRRKVTLAALRELLRPDAGGT